MDAAFSGADHEFMARALRLAERGLFSTRPNPRVGCVLVRDGRVVGEGAHLRAGGPHAEVWALRTAGEAARGATAYVTLEPCCHHGRTPPCADALVEAGVARVVAAMSDPNPRVAGEGLARLRAAGLEVAVGLLAPQAEGLNPGFVKRMRGGLPYLRVKLAASLDGRTAMAGGESRWISSTASRRDVHRLRARSCAILTGSGTVLADDPLLTARDVELPADWPGQPLRVVLDRGLRMSPAARLLRDGGALVFHAGGRDGGALLAAGAELEVVPANADGLDLRAVLRRLAERGLNEVLVEAGPALAGAFVAEGLTDELIVYLAPHLMGHEGRPLLKLPGLKAMADRLPLSIADCRMLGPDLRLTLRPGPLEE